MVQYLLGPVKPHVNAAASEIGGKFNVSTVHGVGTRSNISYHPLGRALDFMVGNDKAKGDAIAAYTEANWARLGVIEMIWYQRIKTSPGGAWQAMQDRGSATQNHFDHVHLSFNATGGTGGPPLDIRLPDFDLDPRDELADFIQPIQDLGRVMKFLSDPKNWLRFAMALGGLTLLVISVMSWGTVKQLAEGVT